MKGLTMTKTLTEQWKDMDLADEHLYYWRMPNGEVHIMNKLGACSYKLCYDGGEIHILAFVPSYDEFKQLVSKNEQLEKQLEIATKALKVFKEQECYYLDYGIDNDGNKIYLYPNRVATKALKEMEGVK